MSAESWPRHPYEVEVSEDTDRSQLEWCAKAADHTSDSNIQKAAARARAELWRREQEAWAERLNFESKERVKEQRFLEAQITRQIDAQNTLMGQQLDVAKEHAIAAKDSVQAAKQSARATIALAILTAVLAAITAVTLFRV